MATIISSKPQKTCNTCLCTFEYDKSDVRNYTEQYWAGFWEGGWLNRIVRFVECPGCGKRIKLN